MSIIHYNVYNFIHLYMYKFVYIKMCTNVGLTKAIFYTNCLDKNNFMDNGKTKEVSSECMHTSYKKRQKKRITRQNKEGMY